MSVRTSLALALAAVAAATATALAVATAANDDPRPKIARVTLHGLTARSAPGSYGLPVPDENPDDDFGEGFLIADSAYPLHPRGRLPATRGAVARIDVRARAKEVSGHLVRRRGNRFDFVGPALDASQADDRGRRWLLRLPKDLRDANALSFDVQYVDGFANFWAGLRPVERWP